MNGLSQFARITQKGRDVSNPKFPYRLVFNPGSETKNLMSRSQNLSDKYYFVKALKGKKVKILFDVYA